MYTWGYIKEATLAKMDLTVNQAIDMGLINKMPFYANEAITQITSSIKANRKYVEFQVRDRLEVIRIIVNKYHFDNIDFLYIPTCNKDGWTQDQIDAWNIYHAYTFTEEPANFPNDFFAWSSDICYRWECGHWTGTSDFDYTTYGSKQIIFKRPGDYRISYLAKWFKILPTTSDETELDAPDDIIEALPSYIASQLYKIDDETKSAILRNEYEMALARIDENDYSTNKVIDIGGNW